MRAGPLDTLRVVELAGLGAGPFAAMVLADLGAEVLRVERPGAPAPARGQDVLARGRRSIVVDLARPGAAAVVVDLAETADVLIEGFRPGVAERLGVGPDDCRARNPRLVYGRVTGWGQEGPWAGMAGHDLDFVAVAGALAPLGPADRPPPPPLNYVADFAGGGMLLVVGVLAALHERRRSGVGQVVDAAMIDGAALHTAQLHGLRSQGLWSDAREDNLLDGAAPFYRCYATADGGAVAVAALEPPFYDLLLRRTGLDPTDWPQHDRARWPALAAALAARFRARTRADWTAVFAGTDACVAPVLDPAEAPRHVQAAARGTFVTVGDLLQPGPAPRFSRTPAGVPAPPAAPGTDTRAILRDAGYDEQRISALHASGVVRGPRS